MFNNKRLNELEFRIESLESEVQVLEEQLSRTIRVQKLILDHLNLSVVNKPAETVLDGKLGASNFNPNFPGIGGK